MSIEAGKITAYLDLDTGKFESKISNSQSKVNSLASQMQSAGGKMSKAGKTITKGVTLPLLAVGAGALKVGMEFEAGMSEVAAISGATGKDLQGLEDLAREMGATTKFSATEAAEGLKYMAMAGWDSSQMAAALPAVLDLAAASGEDLGTTSDIVTDALTAFGMKAEDAAGFADLLASASSNSNTNVSLLGESFKYVAPVMGALGVTADDTAMALGLMANAGIKGSQSGTQLRTVMSNMIKPTKQQATAMAKYGVEMQTNADGSVNLKGTMDNLRTTLGGLDETQQAAAASTIFGKEAMSGALAIVNASETDYKKLTDSTTNYNGAAKEMADIMQDNLQGNLTKLKSALEETGISLAETLIPMMTEGVEKVQALADKFNALDDEQKESIVKWGLILAAAGPVLTLFGKMTSGVGGVIGVVTKLSSGLGAAGATTGLIGSLSALGPLAVGGIAIAGLIAIDKEVRKLRDGSLELEDINLDLAESFIDQEVSLRESITAFELLSKKSSLTNEELAELNNLNEKISRSSNPGEISQLKDAYALLAEKSGLTKEELEKLFEANKNIIEQSPTVETAISNEGDAFVVSTEKAREYANALNDMSRIEMEIERAKLLANESKVRTELAEQIKEQTKYEEMTTQFMASQSMGLGEIDGRLKEIKQIRKDINYQGEEDKVLLAERNMLQAIQNGDMELANKYFQDGLVYAQELNQKQIEKVASLQEELDKLGAVEQQMVDNELRSIGINEQGAKGLAQLDETLAKNQEELTLLDEKLRSNEGLTEEEKIRHKHLLENNTALEKTKEHLYEEYGVYKDINALADMKLDKLDKEKRKKVESLAESVGISNVNKDILGTLDKQMEKHRAEKKQLEENGKQKGANKKEIDKQIGALDAKLGKEAEVKKALMIELGIWGEVDQSIRDGINSEVNKGNAVDGTTEKLDKQGNKISENNQNTQLGIGFEGERTAEAGRAVVKEVKVDDFGTTAKVNKAAEEKKRKEIEAHDGGSIDKLNKKASSPIKKLVTFIGGMFPKFADGTPSSGHKGGMAIVGDGGGRELITLPNGKAFLSPNTDTMLNLPKGTHVASHKDTNKILNNIPKYANGTSKVEFSKSGSVNLSTSMLSMGNGKELDLQNKRILDIQAKAIKEREELELKASESMMKIAIAMNAEKMKENINLNRDIKELELKSHDAIKSIKAKAKDAKRGLNNKEKQEILQITRESNRDIAKLEQEKSTDINKIIKNGNIAVTKLEKELQVKVAAIKKVAKNNNRDTSEKEKKEILELTKKYNDLISKEEKRALESRNRIIQKNSAEFLKESEEYVTTKKAQNQMSVKEEIAYWDKISRTVHSKSKEYIKALEYKQNALSKINSDMVLNNESYADKIRQVDKDLLNDTNKLNDEYDKAYENRVKSIVNVAGLFDKFTESKPISSANILKNMESQVKALDEYEYAIADLGGRIDNEALMDELRALGPKAIGQLKSLNNMSAGELQKYVSLYEDRFKKASLQAEKELKPLKNSTQEEIKNLTAIAGQELHKLEKEWQQSIERIVNNSDNEFKNLKDVGQNAIKGLELGMLDMESSLMDTANRIAESVKSTISKALDINSPSVWAEKHIGRNIGLGWIKGIDSQEKAIMAKARDMTDWVKLEDEQLRYNVKTSTDARSSSVIDYKKLADTLVDSLKKEGLTKPATLVLDGKQVGKGMVNILDSELRGKSIENEIGRGGLVW